MSNATVIDGEGQGTKKDNCIDLSDIEIPTRRLKVLMPIFNIGDEERSLKDRCAKMDVIEGTLEWILKDLTSVLKENGVEI